MEINQYLLKENYPIKNYFERIVLTMKKNSIPTWFNGILFRSRTEARLAVAFTDLDIKFDYEIEGYELSDGTRYLPDFYLPEFDTWLEVKGVMEDYDEHKIKMFEKDFGLSVIIMNSNFQFMDLKGTEIFLTKFGFSDEEGEGIKEAFENAQNYQFTEVVEKKDFVDNNELSRLFDLKASYLNDYYEIQSAYPRIKNQVCDTINFKYLRTRYFIYIYPGQREDFIIYLFKGDEEVVHFSVKEHEVCETCRKIFRLGFLMHDDDLKARGRHHDEIIDQKMNEISAWLKNLRLVE